MKRIGEIIKRIVETDPRFSKLREIRIGRVWREVVGDLISSKAEILGFENGILKVRCEDPLWMNELRLRSEDIKRKMNERLEDLKIEKIEIRRGWGWRSTPRRT